MKKINLGCGWRNFGGDWIHIDGGDYDHLDSKDIFDFPYKEVDLIYASHLIEYFDNQEIIPILKKWIGNLKVGGILRVAVPNFKSICQIYQQGNDIKNCLGLLYGKMKMGEIHIYHKTTYDEDSLTSLFESIGLANIKKWEWREVDHGVFDDHSQAYFPHMNKDNGLHMSLNIEGQKTLD